MIESTLSLLVNLLNRYFASTMNPLETFVVLSSLLAEDGKLAPSIANKLAVFLVNVEEAHDAKRPGANHFILHVMIAANFSEYQGALAFLSQAAEFFQRFPVFDQKNTPELMEKIGALTVQVENLSIQDSIRLWSTLGGKYIPSILYKVELLPLRYEGDVATKT